MIFYIPINTENRYDLLIGRWPDRVFSLCLSVFFFANAIIYSWCISGELTSLWAAFAWDNRQLVPRHGPSQGNHLSVQRRESLLITSNLLNMKGSKVPVMTGSSGVFRDENGAEINWTECRCYRKQSGRLCGTRFFHLNITFGQYVPPITAASFG